MGSSASGEPRSFRLPPKENRFMPQLLVSVRNAMEARIAVRYGAGLIDVKEPRHGSLGKASRDAIEQVVRAVDGHVPASAALGELIDGPDAADLPPGVALAKLGMSGCVGNDAWRDRWRRALQRFPRGIAPVAVAYADWRTARAPSPQEILEVGAELGCAVLLVDTFDKSWGGLLDHWPLGDLADFVAQVRKRGLRVVLAGSLTPEAIPKIAALGPDFVAVRGAVCQQCREGRLMGSRVRRLVRLLRPVLATSVVPGTRRS
jgi:uncharacterized protein (UPF0264 family)